MMKIKLSDEIKLRDENEGDIDKGQNGKC